MASNGYENVVDEITELIERGIVTNEFDIDFCKKLLAMHGSRPVIENHIHKLQDSIAQMEEMNVKRHIRL
jgi:hypothetical protein